MNDNVRKIFDILGIEPNEEFKIEHILGYMTDSSFYMTDDLTIFDSNKERRTSFLQLLLNGTYKIVKLPKEPKKKKLRDLTEEEWNKWKEKNCDNCTDCIFSKVYCDSSYTSWINNKDLYSDKFLDQEIEVEG